MSDLYVNVIFKPFISFFMTLDKACIVIVMHSTNYNLNKEKFTKFLILNKINTVQVLIKKIKMYLKFYYFTKHLHRACKIF